jgi:hypothetical protein
VLMGEPGTGKSHIALEPHITLRYYCSAHHTNSALFPFIGQKDDNWIDPISLELLTATVERVPQLRLLRLITGRTGFTLPWPTYSHLTTIPLARLGRRDGAQLVVLPQLQ